jgi:hypothetical protein
MRLLRLYFTGEPDAWITCLSGSEGAGRKRTPAMVQRAALRPYLLAHQPYIYGACTAMPVAGGQRARRKLRRFHLYAVRTEGNGVGAVAPGYLLAATARAHGGNGCGFLLFHTPITKKAAKPAAFAVAPFWSANHAGGE